MADLYLVSEDFDLELLDLYHHFTTLNQGIDLYAVNQINALATAMSLEGMDGKEEMDFLELVEARSIEAFSNFKKGTKKRVSSNIDFYSGFVYDMIGIPKEIFTPLFAMARIVGWCAHRNEEITFAGKRIIRPGYSSIAPEKPYIEIQSR